MNRHTTPPETTPTPLPWSQLNRESAEAVSAVFTEWLQDVASLQKHLLAFYNQRMEKDAALLGRLAECTSPGNMLDLQAEMLTGMTADYAELGQQLLAQLGDAAQRRWDMLSKVSKLST